MKMSVSSVVTVFLLFHSRSLLSAAEELSCSRSNNVNINETEDGFYLGSVPNSYISYGSRLENIEQLNVSLELKTSQNSGMIFYVSGSKKDFFGLYLRDHDLQVSYHCDGYLNSYSVRVPTNDGKWHKIQLTSNGTRTEVIIDENVYTGRTSGCKSPALVSPYFFGSVDKIHFEMAKSHLENHNKPFVGCMKNFKISEADNSTFSGVIPCRTHAEPGVAFGGLGSYVLLDQNFDFNGVHNLRMEIKSRTNNGHLLYYKTRNGTDYLLLQLIGGFVKLTVSNDDGLLSTTFNCSNTFNICDGRWHSISVKKSKNIYVLAVDSKTAPPIFYHDSYNFKGSGPLYLGGLPTVYAGVGYLYEYIGCVKNFDINGKQEDYFSFKRSGDVTINMCT